MSLNLLMANGRASRAGRRESCFTRGTGMCAVFCFEASRSKPRVARPETKEECCLRVVEGAQSRLDHVCLWASRLSHLDDVAIRISDVAADLDLVLFGRRQELGSSSAPRRVGRVDVRHP
jgi:hypothetical protein